MKIDELVSIALGNADLDRVELTAFEPAVFETRSVSPVVEIVAELAGNALRHGSQEEPVRIAGLWENGDYLISISDRGPGMTEKELRRYNGLLADFSRSSRYPGGMLGLPIVARLAVKHSLKVQLVPGAPGICARVQIPPSLVSRPVPDAPETLEPIRDEVETPESPAEIEAPDTDGEIETDTIDDVFNPYRYQGKAPEPVPMEDLSLVEANGWHPEVAEGHDLELQMEEFLASVFSPLVGSSGRESMWSLEFPNGSEEPLTMITRLRVRVPGDHYELADDTPSTASAERAIDIKTALATFDAGRRSAREQIDTHLD